MWIADKWKDYTLLSGSGGEKLEKWGKYTYLRPDPQIIWQSGDFRRNADAVYTRSGGGGYWDFNVPASGDGQNISYRDLKFFVKPMGFKHMGIFPEQAVNWDFMRSKIENSGREIRVLNLFAYTGGATVACLKAGAKVCHVDASKGMVAHAKQNVELNSLSGGNVRYIVDDCLKFVQREARRGKKYDAVVMDPPSYGRGPNGEKWEVDVLLNKLVSSCMEILSDEPLFFVVNTYSTGIASSAVSNLLKISLGRFGGAVSADEIGLPFKDADIALPAGCTARWESL